MIGLLVFLTFLITAVAMFLTDKRPSIKVSGGYGSKDIDTTDPRAFKVPIILLVLGIVIGLAQPFSAERIDAGFKGIKIKLTGSERGELASSQDNDTWLTYLQSRREDYATPIIIIALIDRLMKSKVIPEKKYTIKWDDLFTVGNKEKADIGKVNADSLKIYADSASGEYVSPVNFFKYILKLPENVADALIADMSKIENTEDTFTEEEEEIEQELNDNEIK
jgi:hypothetical protein